VTKEYFNNNKKNRQFKLVEDLTT